MKSRSHLAAGTLAAFLTTQGICPVPAWALRPSVEGVQSGLEQELNPAAGVEEDETARFFRVMKQLGYETDTAVAEALVGAGYTGRRRRGHRGDGLSRAAVNFWRNRKNSLPSEALDLLPGIYQSRAAAYFFGRMKQLGYETDPAVAEALVEAGYTGQGRRGPRSDRLSRVTVNFWRNGQRSLPFEALDLLPNIPPAGPLEETKRQFMKGMSDAAGDQLLVKSAAGGSTELTTGVEESELRQGWRAVQAGDSNRAAMQWSRWIQRNGLGALYENLANRLEGLQRRSSKLEMKEFSEVLYAAYLVLADPLNTSSMGTAEVDRWRERFSDLEDQASLLSGEVGKDQRLRIQTRLDRMPERQRLRYLRQAAGFQTPARMERAAHVAHAVVSRFEQGKRGLGSHTARKIRRLLEKRTGLTLTLSFRVLHASLDQDLNLLPSADARFAFIKEELLGWSYGQLPRIASPYRAVRLSAKGTEIRIQSYEQAAHRTRRALRQALEEGLSKQWHVPVQLDGQLRVLTHSAREHLPGLKSVEERLRWLRDEVLIWSRAELMRRARAGRTLLRESLLPQGIPLAAWRRVRRQLEQGLAERGEKIHLDDRLLPADRPKPESTERLLRQLLPAEERLRTNFQVRLAARRELMRRFIRPVSSDPNARAQEQAQILTGLIGELDLLRLSALRQGNGARPSGTTRYATSRDFVRWATSASVYPQVQRILSSMRVEEVGNALGWLAQMSSQTKIWRPLSRKLETLWVAAGGRSAAGVEEKLDAPVRRALLKFETEPEATTRLSVLEEQLGNFQPAQRAQFVDALPWLSSQENISHLFRTVFTEDSELARQVRSRMMTAFEDTKANPKYALGLILKILLTWMTPEDSRRIAEGWERASRTTQSWATDPPEELRTTIALGFSLGILESSIRKFQEAASPRKKKRALYYKMAELHSQLSTLYANQVAPLRVIVRGAEGSTPMLIASASHVIEDRFEVLHTAVGQHIPPASLSPEMRQISRIGGVSDSYQISQAVFSGRMEEGTDPLVRLITMGQLIELEGVYADYLSLTENSESKSHYAQEQKLRKKRSDLIQKRRNEFGLNPSAGVEEIGEVVQGPGVVVIGPEALEMRAGLEELVRRAPREIIARMIFYGVGAALASRLRELNPSVRVIEEEDLTGLAMLLLSLPEAEKVTVIGLLALAKQLEQILPATMSVARLDPSAAFRLILAAMGIPEQVLDQIDASGLEEQLTRSRAA